MPPFRLEKFKETRKDRKNLRMLYTRGEYSEGIKITDWKVHLDQKPFDNNPYGPERVNHFLSHYKRLSANDDIDFTTTNFTVYKNPSDTIQQSNVAKKVYNYYTYKDKMMTSCGGYRYEPPDFLTIMQKDYKCPYPYQAKPIKFPPIPFLQYRRLRLCNYYPQWNDNKFYDEQFDEETRQLIRLKSARYLSYNPMKNDWVH